MFDYFWETIETIPEGLGFSQFSVQHIIETGLCAIFVVAMTIWYKKANKETRERISFGFVVAVLADEAFKHIGLLAFGNWLPSYLPLHLCSINILMITIYHFTKNKLVGNFLYCFCIPGALLALLFPTWKALPTMNFMHLHSLTVHALLVSYPIMLTIGGDIKKDYRVVPKMLVLFACMCVPVFFVNVFCGTNFMFMMEAPAGSPLAWFEAWLGNYLWGFVILLPLVIGLMYIPYKKVED